MKKDVSIHWLGCAWCLLLTWILNDVVLIKSIATCYIIYGALLFWRNKSLGDL